MFNNQSTGSSLPHLVKILTCSIKDADILTIKLRNFFIVVLGFLFMCGAVANAAQMDPQSRLVEADGYRMLGESTKSIVEVTELEDEKLKRAELYEVYSKQGKGSLVVFKSAADAGQKMLMLDDKFWMFLPRTRRPIRITPMQKLLGDASAGDLSALSWSESYEIDGAVKTVDFEGIPAVVMPLQSSTKGNTYDRIELVLSDDGNFPLKADLYLKSGKLAKVATFEKGEREGVDVVASMKLKDSIKKNSETIISYKDSEPAEIADKLFNPSFLIKNNLDNL